MPAPKGKAAVFAFYGKPDPDNLAQWEAMHLVYVSLPMPMYLAWDDKVPVTRVRIHKLCADVFLECWAEVWNEARRQIKLRDGFDHNSNYYDLEARKLLHTLRLDMWGGSYINRQSRRSAKLSTHALGCAFDIDPAHNELGQKTCTFPKWFSKIWIAHGWKMGKDFKDPMHIQYCSGY